MRWLLALMAMCTVFAASASQPVDTQAAARLRSAYFVASNARQPPVEGWREVELPDSWREQHASLDGFAWYRIPFTLAAQPDKPLALYIPHLALIGEIRLNGSLLTPDIRFDASDGRMGTSMDMTPVYLTLPSGLFRSGENMLEVRLQGNPRMRSGMSEVLLGPPEALHSAYMVRYVILVAIPAVIMVLLIASLCFVAVYSWRRRNQFAIQFSLVTGIGLLVIYFSYQLSQVSATRNTEETLRIVTATLVFWGLCIGAHHLCTTRLRGLMPCIHAFSGVCIIATLIWAFHGDVGDRAWLLTWPLLPLRIAMAGVVAYDGWRRHNGILIALGVTGQFWMVTLAQSDLMLNGMLPWDSFTLSIAGGLPCCAVVLYYFAERFVVDREESLLAQQAAIVAERERILQDMHDGMGAQLITALRLARREDIERSEVARYIEESFFDLRLIIDSLDLTDSDLLPLLGNLRFRLDPRLRALGIQLIWDVEPLPNLDYLTPASALAISRVVQEALNNAIQHARAQTIRVSVKPEGHSAVIRIIDDGKGFDPQVTQAGSRGIGGMRQRAVKLGAKLELRSGQDGTEVVLWLP